MKVFLILVLLEAVAAMDNDKIVGGFPCLPHSRCFQVSLVSLNDGYHFCGGSLINESWVVSAAHCAMSKIEVRLGQHNISKTEGTEQFIQASKVIQHENYKYFMNNDIMLIKLSTPAELNEYVQTIKLPSPCATAGTMCEVSGWGDTLEGTPDILQCLCIPILTDEECENCYPGMITPSMFCAGYLEGGKDACDGDSGGPLECDGVLQGIVSWGYGCALANYPSVYTKVCIFSDWIKEKLSNN
ncbi:trypsin-2-like [Latimeria chalumnae]|uniref:trypsin-2-like n=1 Tax=Latimeria chalumnae TaxID=7897 RepID=UPI0003C13C68|nr:PREDICTED: trypsin-2-like [Latimeria chalumnae]|eukprot:XP_006011323.1 PREDICTED: trypsin-2-like [Latimeria chalumnae]